MGLSDRLDFFYRYSIFIILLPILTSIKKKTEFPLNQTRFGYFLLFFMFNPSATADNLS